MLKKLELMVCFTIQNPIVAFLYILGIVFGALTPQGKIDRTLMSAVRSLSEGMLLTFHRAFDVCTDSLEDAVEAIIALGCDRVLTSGRACNVSEGRDVLKTVTQLAKGRITVVAGCGVTSANVYQLIKHTEVQGVHAGSAVTVKKDGSDSQTNSAITTTGVTATATLLTKDMLEWECVDSTKVSSLMDKARRAWAGKTEVEEVTEEDVTNEEDNEDKFDMLSPARANKSPGSSDGTPSSRERKTKKAEGVDGSVSAETVPSNLDKSYIYLPGKNQGHMKLAMEGMSLF